MCAIAGLIVQFSQAIFNGTEVSGSIVLTIDLLGGFASNNVTVIVNTSPVTATGKQTVRFSGYHVS